MSFLHSQAMVGLAISCSVMTGACDHPRATRVDTGPPELLQLEVLATIASDSLWPSGLVATDPCRLWLAGSSWGVVVEVNLSEGTENVLGRLPQHAQGSRLSLGPSGTVVAWSSSPIWAGLIDKQNRTYTSLSPPQHPWVGQSFGPMVTIGGRSLAVAPLG